MCGHALASDGSAVGGFGLAGCWRPHGAFWCTSAALHSQMQMGGDLGENATPAELQACITAAVAAVAEQRTALAPQIQELRHAREQFQVGGGCLQRPEGASASRSDDEMHACVLSSWTSPAAPTPLA